MEILTMFQLLTAPETLAQPTLAHRFMVELVSNELVLDAQGISVPQEFKTVDVCVMSPTVEAIATLLQATGHLDGWNIVSHWVPSDCDCF